MILRLFLLSSLLLGTSLASQAQLIDIAIDPSLTNSGIDPMSGAAVLGSANDKWNLLTTNVPENYALVDTTGAETGVTFTTAHIPVPDWLPSFDGDVAHVNKGLAPGLLGNFLTQFGGAANLTLTGLTALTTYQLELYGPNFGSGKNMDYDVNGVTGTLVTNQATVFTSTVITPPTGDDAYTVSGNYIEFFATTDASGNLTISLTPAPGGNDSYYFSGLQVQAVPEPGAGAMMLAGLALLAFCLRRKALAI